MDEIVKIRLGLTNNFLLRVTDGYILIDGGVGRRIRKFLRYLDDYNISPDMIKYIIVTHAHYDHVGSLAETKKITGAKVIAHKDAVEPLKQGRNAFVGIKLKWFNPIIRWMIKRFMKYTPVKPDIIIDDEFYVENYENNFKLIHTPGHTLCSISLIDKQGNAFVGDTVMRYPFKPLGGFSIIAADFKLLVPSWRKIIGEGVKTVYLAHGKPIKIERMLRKTKRRK